ncbi:Threonylcarbamoyl-AMP synthase [Symbiodinium microadriaticum]|uniref:Threonylcarbamoyl-AMP synthase n=1 Tax=Symbiodinium microadriaticum TaxID=2951 RepID=A0A1Q9F2M6_SYMMI|nr:Threonylcarbamoyl-AMP synthase [Symbiodinium microadriaticum]
MTSRKRPAATLAEEDKAACILRPPHSSERFEALGAALRRGRLVAFPTETVYGLGANGLDPDAVLQIFEAKGRPLTDPCILHVSKAADAHALLDLDPDARAVFDVLTKEFWPGPLSIVGPARPVVPPQVTASTGFVAVRCPSHPLARQLVEAAGKPLAAPSANRFGHISPTLPDHVLQDLQHVPFLQILDGGPCNVGIESTVLKLDLASSAKSLLLLRQGGVPRERLLLHLVQLLHQLDRLRLSGLFSQNTGAAENPSPPGSAIGDEERVRLTSKYALELEKWMGSTVFSVGLLIFSMLFWTLLTASWITWRWWFSMIMVVSHVIITALLALLFSPQEYAKLIILSACIVSLIASGLMNFRFLNEEDKKSELVITTIGLGVGLNVMLSAGFSIQESALLNMIRSNVFVQVSTLFLVSSVRCAADPRLLAITVSFAAPYYSGECNYVFIESKRQATQLLCKKLREEMLQSNASHAFAMLIACSAIARGGPERSESTSWGFIIALMVVYAVSAIDVSLNQNLVGGLMTRAKDCISVTTANAIMTFHKVKRSLIKSIVKVGTVAAKHQKITVVAVDQSLFTGVAQMFGHSVSETDSFKRYMEEFHQGEEGGEEGKMGGKPEIFTLMQESGYDHTREGEVMLAIAAIEERIKKASEQEEAAKKKELPTKTPEASAAEQKTTPPGKESAPDASKKKEGEKPKKKEDEAGDEPSDESEEESEDEEDQEGESTVKKPKSKEIKSLKSLPSLVLVICPGHAIKVGNSRISETTTQQFSVLVGLPLEQVHSHVETAVKALYAEAAKSQLELPGIFIS